MADIVERLRERAAAVSEGPMASTMMRTLEWEAAEELESTKEAGKRLYDLLREVSLLLDSFDEDEVQYGNVFYDCDMRGIPIERAALDIHDALEDARGRFG